MIWFSKTNRIGSWEEFSLFNVQIGTISGNLSRICHFAGACGKFFSVAEHSLLVAEQIGLSTADPRLKLTALLHDAGEAYYGDIIHPVKCNMKDSKATRIFTMVDKAIVKKFSLYTDEEQRAAIKMADLTVLQAEMVHFFGENKCPAICCMEPRAAEECFYNEFIRLASSIGAEELAKWNS